MDFIKNLETEFTVQAETHNNELRPLLEAHAQKGTTKLTIYKSGGILLLAFRLAMIALIGGSIALSPFAFMGIGFGSILSAIIVLAISAWLAKYVYHDYVQAQSPFLVFTPDNIVFAHTHQELPWLSIEDHNSTITSVNSVRNIVIKIDLTKGASPPDTKALRGVKYDANKHQLRIVIVNSALIDVQPKKKKISLEDFAQTFHDYWLGAQARYELTKRA